MPCIYLLKSSLDNTIYKGSSREDTPEKRVKAHNAGKTRSTKARRPWSLIYTEQFETYSEARRRENFLKTGPGRKWIKENVLKRGDESCPQSGSALRKNR